MVGLIANGHMECPLTQADLADRAGMTAVHTNRMLQQLRSTYGLSVSERSLAIPDFEKFADAVGFDRVAWAARPGVEGAIEVRRPIAKGASGTPVRAPFGLPDQPQNASLN